MTSGQRDFPVVGIGSSAGGLEATETVLKGLPPKCGMAIVIVQHLAPDYESQLPSILARSSRMKVVTATNGARVVPNCVYVIPPNRALRIEGGVLRLHTRKTGLWNSIDEFLTSLASDRGESAVGIVLSGEASDGTEGLGRIKAAGGITFAQQPGSAGHSSMPASAIASGAVDFVLPPAAIARELKRIGAHRFLKNPTDAPASEGASLKDIFAILRAKKNVDFSGYRQGSVMRRILRRMAIKRVSRVEAYVAELRRDPAETAALLDDLLIKVTSFFRDPLAFKALKAKVYPQLFGRTPSREPVRLWVAGCSTGEEAYSHLINMLEFIGNRPVPLQIFATDLSERALDAARLGIYPERIAHELSPDRLRKFFVKVPSGYQVRKSLRDLCVFARHDILRDPPFGNLDLLSCRNVLIYFDNAMQRRVLPIFHYALKPGGALLLGSSEGVGEFSDRFAAIDKSCKLYGKKNVSVRAPIDFAEHSSAPVGVVRKAETEMESRPSTGGGKRDLQSSVEAAILESFSPAGVVVDKHFDIVFSKGDTSPYLTLGRGRPALNLFKMARVDLVVELRALLEKAKKEGGPVTREGLQIKRESRVRALTLHASPIAGTEPLWLVLFSDSPYIDTAHRLKDESKQLSRLRQELTSTREYLRKVSQEQDSSSEEVRAANEEILASNEELQSTNEELQIAKEELQSANEEMGTVNEELSVRNGELNALTNDLSNLLNSSHLPIVMLGSDLHIRRMTPSAERVLGLLPAHVGKSLIDIPLSVSIPGLEKMLTETIDSASIRESEVQDRRGRWYQLSVRPYMTSDKKIDGAVLTFLDVSDRCQALAAHRERQAHAEAIVNTVIEPLVVLDDGLRITSMNVAFGQMFGVNESAAKGEPLFMLKKGRWNTVRLRTQLESLMGKGKPFATFEFESNFRGRGRRTHRASARLIDSGSHREILLAMEDVTDRNAANEAESLRQREQMQRDFLADISHELRTPIATIKGFAETMLVDGLKDVKHSLEFLQTIDRHASRLHDLVEDLLTLSSLESGRKHLRPQPVLLRGLIDDIIETVAPSARVKSVSIKARIPENIKLLADKTQLSGALRNLIENAVKFNKTKGRVEVNAELYGTEVRISVHDTGMGITKADQARVLKRFYRARSARAKGLSGNGLGLAITKTIAEAHGGRLWLDSVWGRGTTFHLALPLRPQNGAQR